MPAPASLDKGRTALRVLLLLTFLSIAFIGFFAFRATGDARLAAAGVALGLLTIGAYAAVEASETRRARAEAALRETERRARAVLDTTHEAFVSIDSSGRITEWNPRAEETFGWPRAEAIGRPLAELIIPPSYRDAHRAGLARFLATGEGPVLGRVLELTALDRTGREFPVEVTISSLRRGAEWTFHAFLHDISERRSSEEALRRSREELEARVAERTAELASSEERFRLAVEAAPAGMLLVEADGRIALANRMMEKTFGYTQVEMIGRPVEFLLPERFRGAHPGHRKDFYASPEVRPMGAGRDLFGLRKDGREVPIEVALAPVRAKEGMRVLSTIVDITERKRAEEKILRESRDLETLLYVVTHDLKEPLRTIEGFSAILSDRYALSLDEKGRDFLRRVVRGAARLRELLDDLLLLARVRRTAPVNEEVESAESAAEVLSRLEGKIMETKARVLVREGLPRIRGERIWITEALYNLVDNALKFTRDGEAPEVEIDAYRPRTGEPPGIGLEVRDRGPGVSPESAENIFQIFQRGVGRDVEGSGAGLAIVRQIAERQGGSAWVRPRRGGGSEFVVTFGQEKEVRNEAKRIRVAAHAGDAPGAGER